MSDASVASMLGQVRPDPWRAEMGFSPEIEAVNQQLFGPARSDEEKAKTLAQWIEKHQPCLFGRLAARAGFLSYSILTEADLESSDEHIQQKIQKARSSWTREAFAGQKNGFIILAISRVLASARPDDVVKQLALRLCSLYLLEAAENVTPDKVLHDTIYLEKPGDERATWTWQAGVNYFCSHGDRRWWHDHRIPGGMAFSVNSVGHMVKSGILLRGMAALGEQLGLDQMSPELHRVTSLEKALELAMRTIDQAAEVPSSGKATSLITLPEGSRLGDAEQAPIKLTGNLAGKNWQQYFGYYHTDYTIPSEYFREDIERPSDLSGHVLDFTYLFRSGADNPAYTTMGEGRRIRHEEELDQHTHPSPHKLARMIPREVSWDAESRLAQAQMEE